MKHVLVIISIIVSCCCYSQSNPSWYYDRMNDKTFAAVELEDTAGNIINTASLAGKTIYVDFWFTACAPCVKEIPHSKALQQFFATDTNIVFLNICIENIQRKEAWKKMIKEKEMTGINLFYALNRPQKVNLLRAYQITFPTYLIVNDQMKVVGYDAPRPSEKGLVHWVLAEAAKGVPLSISLKQGLAKSKEYLRFVESIDSFGQ